MAKKKKGDGITFAGMSSNEVTGSCYHIQFAGKQILLECGLYQASSNDYLDSYKINSKKFPFKPSEISYIFVEHCHIDHIGLLPRLIKEGFKGKIILTDKAARIAEALLRNCAFIVADEARILSKRYNRDYSPLYTSVLQDIADIYNEIEETDKKTKSNNVNLLLETIAGKNRANTAASILQSPDILREAIESSKNAKGSADRENETYLSSLEAHITQLQTQLQELATVTINSDMFKGVIDTATAFLNIVTQILDKLPLLSTAIGGLAGFKLSKAGLGKQLNIKLVSI